MTAPESFREPPLEPTRSSLGLAIWTWGPALAVMAIIFIGSSFSRLEPLDAVPDKSGHGAVYAVLGGLLLRALAGATWRGVTRRAAATALGIALAYGISDEIHQAFVPGRSPEIADVAADGVGAGLAIGALWAWSIIRSRRDARPT